MEARKVSLFRNGRSQAVRIPKELELQGKHVLIHKEGDRLIIAPDEPKDLIAWLKTLGPMDENTGEIEDLPPEDVEV
ncbi:MAG: antitoxin [Beijerinckiaceae bacterium]